MKIHDSHIFIDMKVSKLGLIRFFTQFLQKWDERTIQIDGYELKITEPKLNDFKISVKGKTIRAGIPVDFDFIKKAGLFSIEGEGHIFAELEIDFDILSDLSFKTDSSLTGHHWIDSPVLKIGTLDIPVETLSNCIIGYMKEKMLDKLDNYLSENVDVQKLIAQQINSYGYNYLISQKPPLYFNLTIDQLLAGKISEDDQDIHIDLWMEITAKITDVIQQFEPGIQPDFIWIDDLPHTHSLNVDIVLSYYGLSKLIMQSLNGADIGGKTFDIESIHIRNTNYMEITAIIREPVKGMVTITGQPYFDQSDHTIHVKDLKVDIEAKNILYKLSSPIIEKILYKKLDALFPFNVAPFFLKYFKNIPAFTFFENRVSLQPEIKSAHLNNVNFQEQQMIITIHLENAEMGVVLNAQ